MLIDKVVGLVGEVFIMMVIGLVVVVLVVFGYNFLVWCNKLVMEWVCNFGV